MLVEMDTLEQHRQMFEASWQRALQKLKELAEAPSGEYEGGKTPVTMAPFQL